MSHINILVIVLYKKWRGFHLKINASDLDQFTYELCNSEKSKFDKINKTK